MHLPDVNLWLALGFEAHAHHRRAADWFGDHPPGSCCFCRLTQQGFLRLATNPSVFGEESLSLPQAWECYDLLRTDERVGFLAEPPGVEPPWRQLTRSRGYSHKVWTDTYLAAFAEAAGQRVATFDRGFSNYRGGDATILGP
ncbi:MAG: hypothetical protein AUJ96_15190 [Armatimonadetes bacterium CG2_30_66_41]|nr:MAG: hypothetical protein AUJ96_15190 [Armatimonadetes bacterium CG2_30_66_41]